jgi:aerobic-type carbon monoxide dehydrogenase small subunit (CoxS/CutS family)
MNLVINGKKRRLDVAPMTRLLDVLRESCGLTGTKEGCGEGECGACTVLVDGVAVNSCIVPVAQVEGCQVVTIEGAAAARRSARALQNAFVEHGGAQCGICTPGMIMAACGLKAGCSRDEIKTALAGNLCRCTGYISIFTSVERALPSPKRRRTKPAARKGARARRR